MWKIRFRRTSEAAQVLLDLLALPVGEEAAGPGVFAAADAGAELFVPAGEAFAFERLPGLEGRGAAGGAECDHYSNESEHDFVSEVAHLETARGWSVARTIAKWRGIVERGLWPLAASLAVGWRENRTTYQRWCMAETTPERTSPETLPPPSFSLLVMTFASQAMVAFGHAPNPIDGKTEVRLEMARHAIDMLDILEQKTKGNLTADEAAMIEGVLHQLRLAFVEATTGK